MKVDLRQVEEAAKELYIRALKVLPPDIKQGFQTLAANETNAGAQRVLGTMIRNIAVAESNDNLLCQDTGIPVYNVWIGRGVEVDGLALKEEAELLYGSGSGQHLEGMVTQATPWVDTIDAVNMIDTGKRTVFANYLGS